MIGTPEPGAAPGNEIHGYALVERWCGPIAHLADTALLGYVSAMATRPVVFCSLLLLLLLLHTCLSLSLSLTNICACQSSCFSMLLLSGSFPPVPSASSRLQSNYSVLGNLGRCLFSDLITL